MLIIYHSQDKSKFTSNVTLHTNIIEINLIDG